MRKLVKYPDPILLQKTTEVTVFDSNLHSLLDDMKQIMSEEKGMGLAANQVGESLSIFLMRDQSAFKGKEPEVIEFINPKALNKSEEQQFLNEGCLSATGIYLQIQRHETVHLQYQDRNGNIKEGVVTGVEAVCVQHEMDHLEGIFYFDLVSRPQRKAALKKLGLK